MSAPSVSSPRSVLTSALRLHRQVSSGLAKDTDAAWAACEALAARLDQGRVQQGAGGVRELAGVRQDNAPCSVSSVTCFALFFKTRTRSAFVRHGQQEEGQAVMTRSDLHLGLLPAATRHLHVLHGLLRLFAC